ncbi:MAG TPA: hypothetical protein VEP49_03550 [Acidimicrobiia bacterium]|nr:hypothetical protein [Acidimicrobiia bacterium]
MSYVRAFFRFWYDFVVGDDWRLALAAAAALGASALAVAASVPAWWVAPVVLSGFLAFVVLREPT